MVIHHPFQRILVKYNREDHPYWGCTGKRSAHWPKIGGRVGREIVFKEVSAILNMNKTGYI
jgi:hypothetical protein